jgi:hypothetical protein
MAVGTQSEVMELAAPVIEEQTDHDFVRAAAPAGILQIEGLLRVTPDDPRLLLLGARSWASFAYGFAEDDMEAADAAGDRERADRQRARARGMYLRARALGLRLLELSAPELPAQLRTGDPDQLLAFLREQLDDEHAAALFWTGYAWGSAINVSRDDPTLLADLGVATALVERSLELDERYFHASAHVFLGVVNASRGSSIGGYPEAGARHFERALELTERAALMVQVNYAQAYAVQKQDRKLFDSLLGEVMAATVEGGSPLSLPNVLAQRKARRLLAQADALILDESPAEPQTPSPASPDAGPSSRATTAKEGAREAS